MSYDFNGADRQSSGFDPIPAGTIVPLTMSIRPGGVGDGGWFKQSQSSDALMLDCEFVVSEGPYGKLNERGESTAGNITRATLRAILESARGIRPDDMGESAQAARRIDGWQDFCGLTFIAKLGVEKDKTGQYADKNRIHTVITPDMKEYSQPQATSSSGWSAQQEPARPSAPAPSPTPVPAWAR